MPVPFSKAAKPLALSALATLGTFTACFLLCDCGVRALGIAFLNHCDIWNRIKAAGFSLEAPPRGPAIPDTENAVYYLNQSMEIPSAAALSPSFHEKAPPFFKNQNEWSFLISFRQMGGGNRIPPEAAAAAARLVREHAETFLLVDKAFGMKADARLRFSCYTDELSDLLACRAYIQIHKGFPKRALRSVEEILFLGDIYRQNPYLAGQLEDTEFFDKAITVFRSVFPKVDGALLNREFLPALRLRQREAGYRLCWPLELFDVDLMHPTDLGWWDYSFKNDITRFFLRDRFNSPVPSILFGFFYWPLEPFDRARLYERSLDALKAIDSPYSRRNQAFQAESNVLKSCHWLSLTVNDRGVGDLGKLDKVIAWVRVTQAAIRARLYREKNKHWPASLSELSDDPADSLDPFTDGATLKIQIIPKGIQIYSQGTDVDVHGLRRGNIGDSGVYGNIGWNLKD